MQKIQNYVFLNDFILLNSLISSLHLFNIVKILPVLTTNTTLSKPTAAHNDKLAQQTRPHKLVNRRSSPIR